MFWGLFPDPGCFGERAHFLCVAFPKAPGLACGHRTGGEDTDVLGKVRYKEIRCAIRVGRP